MKSKRADRKERSGKLSLLLELTKFRLVSLVLFSTGVGYYLAVTGPVFWPHLLHVLAATGLVAGGSLAMNQWAEHAQDLLMPRTAGRPIPSGRITPSRALVIALVLSAAGLVYLFFAGGLLSTVLAGITTLSYVAVYTPLKRVTSLNTIVGALPGAIPPMIGWAAAGGGLSFGAWILFSILFLWQLPHFLAIAWLFRDQYRKAGFVMLSLQDENGRAVSRQAVISLTMLLPVSLMPTITKLTGMVYFFGALVLGLVFLGAGIAGMQNLERHAKSLFGMSILYLAMLLLLMIVDKA